MPMKLNYDPNVFTIPEGIDRESFLVAYYYVEGRAADILRKAGEIAVGQTTGTWMPVPEETAEIRSRHVGRVISLFEVPPLEEPALPDSERRFIAAVAFPVVNIGFELPSLLVTLFGKVSMDGKIKLIDIIFPQSYVARFCGPKFGIEGVRRLTGVYDRPLLMSIFKPGMGLSPKALAELFYKQAAGGVDIVKDDEILPDVDFCPFEARLEACLEAAERAARETGKRTLYAINLSGPPDRIVERAARAVKNGANCLLVNGLALGLGTLKALAECEEVSVPLMAHPALAGAFYGASDHGISSPLLLGKLMRLAGGDIVLFPSPYGTVALRREPALRIGAALTSPFYNLRRSFPVPSAGIHPGLVEQIVADFGIDVIVNAGGGVHGHPQGATAGGRAFIQAINSVMSGMPLEQAAEKYQELGVAVKLWGTGKQR